MQAQPIYISSIKDLESRFLESSLDLDLDRDIDLDLDIDLYLGIKLSLDKSVGALVKKSCAVCLHNLSHWLNLKVNLTQVDSLYVKIWIYN